jgi:ring-1,2-phenylacetyl-CoA epoxidase subunit PaaE
LRIRRVIPLTPEASTFEFETPDGTPLPYRPGQFLTLLVTLNGRELRRSYSFSSAPGIDPYPAVPSNAWPTGKCRGTCSRTGGKATG